MNESISVNGAGLYVGSKKINGLNLNEVSKQAQKGKDLLLFGLMMILKPEKSGNYYLKTKNKIFI
jgi:hypothetical protein